MSGVDIVLGVCLIASIISQAYLVRWCMIVSGKERKDLEDRLLAMTNTEAYVAVKALEELPDEDEDESSIRYVDEQRMNELQRTLDGSS